MSCTPQEQRDILADFATKAAELELQQEPPGANLWRGSPFAWMPRRANAAKHAVGKALLMSMIRAQLGLDVKSITIEKASGLEINHHKVSVKTSYLWNEQRHAFQQIRRGPFSHVLCFGVSPTVIHIWLIPVGEPALYGEPQHVDKRTGVVASWALHVQPHNIQPWLHAYGGEAADGLVAIYDAFR